MAITSFRLKKITSPFLVPIRFESAYKRAILQLVQRETPLMDETGVDGWLTRFSFVSSDPQFKLEAQRIATSLTRDINVQNVFGWRETARKVPGGTRVYPFLHETRKRAIGQAVNLQIAISSEYIRLVPEKIARKIAKDVEEARSEGATEKGCLNLLRREVVSGLVRRVSLLAQTDPHRINTALTEARSVDLGIPCFIWSTAKDGVVRHSHHKMEGVVVFWRDLPSPELLIGQPANLGYYSPGNCPNCRCGAIPVISIDELFKDPKARIKVYYDGQIHLMSRNQFIKLLD